MKFKVHNRIFIEASYCFINLVPYYEHMTALLRRSSKQGREFRERLKIEYQRKNKEFDEQYWHDSQKIYDEVYPRFLNYSFLVSTCSIFEYQLKRICDLVKEEHKMPFGWDMDNSKDSTLIKIKRYLKLAGVILIDDPPRIELPPPDFKPTEVLDESRAIIKVLWEALGNYFMVRNCIVHNNGLINKARNPERIRQYAAEKGITLDNQGQPELLINEEFNKEVCNTMHQFFNKLHSAYYSTPLSD